MTDTFSRTDRISKTLNQAGQWFAFWRGDTPEGSERQRQQQEFAGWLGKSPDNRSAYEAVETTWEELGAFSGSDAVRQVIEDARRDHQQRQQVIDRLAPATKPRRRLKRIGVPVAWAACLLLAVGALLYWHKQPSYTLYQTALGEQQMVKLQDGTVIKLNTDTILKVHSSSEKRHAVLESGQAFFEVTKNAERPFYVQTDYGTVTVLGTAFDLYTRDGRVTLSLTEGKVKVTGPAIAESLELEVAPDSGDARRVDLLDDRVSEVQTVAANEIQAWQNNKAIFDSVPLNQAVAEINRYNSYKIVIADPDLKSLRISGVFQTDKPELFVAALKDYYPIAAIDENNRRTVLIPVTKN